MNNLIDFFELLKFDKISSNLEFSIGDEQLTITKGNDAYLFYFTKTPIFFRTNLCKEIMLITENSADLKLDFNNQLADYLELKLENKSMDELIESNIDCPKDFILQFEKKLNNYYNFNYIYLDLKIKRKYPENKKVINNNKI